MEAKAFLAWYAQATKERNKHRFELLEIHQAAILQQGTRKRKSPNYCNS